MSEQQRPWIVRIRHFFAYMRDKGYRQTFLQFGQVFRPLGMSALPDEHRNDNRPGRTL